MPGARQKRKFESDRLAARMVHSSLAELLVRMCVMGEIQATTAQKVAFAGRVDIVKTVEGQDVLHELGKLAGMGTEGEHSRNCRTQLYSYVLASPSLLCSTILTPMKNLGPAGGAGRGSLNQCCYLILHSLSYGHIIESGSAHIFIVALRSCRAGGMPWTSIQCLKETPSGQYLTMFRRLCQYGCMGMAS